ncbi:MAG: Sec-independent protein translocase subunit TatA [Nocardioidaceae bacterium]
MPGPPEMLLILLVLVLLFGAKKLPDLARGTGRALRIFKSETKGLGDDDDDESDDRRTADNARSQITSPRTQPDVTDPTAPTSAETSGPLPPTHTEK